MSKTSYIINGALCIVLFAACKKETEYAPYPYREITSFVVPDGGTGIDAAVVGTDIIVYWPYTMNLPDSIAPQLTVSENAMVLPASGKNVAFQNGTTYTVTAQDGTVSTYTLKLEIYKAAIRWTEPTVLNANLGERLNLNGIASDRKSVV